MRIHVPTRLRWSDLDAYGHVNNAQMFGLLEEARIHAFWEGDNGAGDAPPTRIFRGGPTADTFTLIAHQEIEYLAPIAYQRDPLDLELWIGRLGGASLEVCYEVWSPVGESPRVLFTRATTTIVLVDSATMKPRRIRDDEREAVEPYLEPMIDFGRKS